MITIKTGDTVIHSVTKSVVGATITASSVADLFGNKVFKLSDLSEASSYSALYDQYKINSIQIDFIPVMMPQGVGPYQPLIYVFDYDDNANATTQQQLLDFANSVIVPSGARSSRVLKPRTLSSLYDGATTQVSGVMSSQWINTDFASIAHYALKYMIPLSSAGIQSSWIVYYKYSVSFKNIR